MVAWTETSKISNGVDHRKEMVLQSWLSGDEADMYWPSDNYHYHLVNETVPDSGRHIFPVAEIIAHEERGVMREGVE